MHKSRYVDLASQIDITVSIHRLRWAMDGKRLIAPLLFVFLLGTEVDTHTHAHTQFWTAKPPAKSKACHGCAYFSELTLQLACGRRKRSSFQGQGPCKCNIKPYRVCNSLHDLPRGSPTQVAPAEESIPAD